MRAPTPGNPRRDFVKSGDVDVRHLRLCGRFVHYSGVVAELNRKDWAVGRGFSKYPPLRRATYDLAQHRLSHSRGLAGLAIPENGRPRDGTTSKAANLREIHGLCDEHGDVASASVLENWIDEAERRTWFLFEATRRSNS
jgi:hypothetical protein